MAKDAKYVEAPRITLSEAKAAFDFGLAIFVDVRDRPAYERAHIPGARQFRIRNLLSEGDGLPAERQIIFY